MTKHSTPWLSFLLPHLGNKSSFGVQPAVLEEEARVPETTICLGCLQPRTERVWAFL